MGGGAGLGQGQGLPCNLCNLLCNVGTNKQSRAEAALQLQPGLRNPQRRLRGNAVPSTARVAAIAVLRQLFPEHRFEEREVRVEVARQLQTSDTDFRFPRLEASIYGRGSPMSLCCSAAVLTFFDVICGVCVICLKSTCALLAVLKFRLYLSAASHIFVTCRNLLGKEHFALKLKPSPAQPIVVRRRSSAESEARRRLWSCSR